METIGARLVNELYINHLFSLALSLHGGTESLTFPYGTPNHTTRPDLPKIPMKYFQKDGKTQFDSSNPDTLKLAKLYRTGKFDMTTANSSEPPDFSTLNSKIYFF